MTGEVWAKQDELVSPVLTLLTITFSDLTSVTTQLLCFLLSRFLWSLLFSLPFFLFFSLPFPPSLPPPSFLFSLLLIFLLLYLSLTFPTPPSSPPSTSPSPALPLLPLSSSSRKCGFILNNPMLDAMGKIIDYRWGFAFPTQVSWILVCSGHFLPVDLHLCAQGCFLATTEVMLPVWVTTTASGEGYKEAAPGLLSWIILKCVLASFLIFPLRHKLQLATMVLVSWAPFRYHIHTPQPVRPALTKSTTCTWIISLGDFLEKPNYDISLPPQSQYPHLYNGNIYTCLENFFSN